MRAQQPSVAATTPPKMISTLILSLLTVGCATF
jgi:hypothetical protein